VAGHHYDLKPGEWVQREDGGWMPEVPASSSRRRTSAAASQKTYFDIYPEDRRPLPREEVQPFDPFKGWAPVEHENYDWGPVYSGSPFEPDLSTSHQVGPKHGSAQLK
jgi:hypothetical protein